MDKKQILLVALLFVIGGLFVYANRDWFRSRPIQITHRIYRFASRFTKQGDPTPVMFEFDRKLKLTSIKILSLNDVLTNKYPQPLWHMVALQRRALPQVVPSGSGDQVVMDLPGWQL